MLEKLPLDLVASVFRQHLDTQSKARLERVSKPIAACARGNGWTAKDYGPCDVTHVPRPDTSEGWRKATRDRRFIADTIAPLLPPHEDCLPLARHYNQMRCFKQALVLMSMLTPEQFPHSIKARAEVLHAALAGLGRADDAAEWRNILEDVAAVDNAIETDDPDLLLAAWRGFRREAFGQALEQAANGNTRCLRMACHVLVEQGLFGAFIAPPYNPVTFANQRRSMHVLQIALHFDCRISPAQIRSAAQWLHHADLDALLHDPTYTSPNGPTPEKLKALLGYLATAHGVPDRERRLRRLIAAGVDVNAPVQAVLSHAAPSAPFLACFALRDTPIAPILQQLVGAGANPHATLDGATAWHRLVRMQPADYFDVAQFLRSAGVDINKRGEARHWTPLAVSLEFRAWNALLQFGASLQGTQFERNGKKINALAMALARKDSRLAVRALQADNPAPRGAVTEASRWMLPTDFTTFVEARRWPQRDLNGAFVKLLSASRKTRADAYEDRLTMLSSLARAGAEVNVLANPYHFGAGSQTRRDRAKRKAPGLWPTAALAIALCQGQRAKPYLEGLVDMGVNLNAQGPSGAHASQALSLMKPADADEAAQYLAQAAVEPF